MAVTKDRPGPYAPPKAILEIIDRYRNRGMPAPINSEVLGRAGIPDSLIPRTLQSLQILDLIDDAGNPTETLEGLRLAPEADYKKALEEWLKGTYADVFSFVDPSQDDEVRIRDAFRSYQPVGQQSRMVTLFLGLCAAAGLRPEKVARKPRERSRLRIPAQPTKRYTARVDLPQGGTQRKAAHDGRGGIPAPIAGLLSQLPPEGQGWTKSRRDQFIRTFSAVLDFCFPLVEEGMRQEAAQPSEEEEMWE
jgi:hypothetical protein